MGTPGDGRTPHGPKPRHASTRRVGYLPTGELHQHQGISVDVGLDPDHQGLFLRQLGTGGSPPARSLVLRSDVAPQTGLESAVAILVASSSSHIPRIGRFVMLCPGTHRLALAILSQSFLGGSGR